MRAVAIALAAAGAVTLLSASIPAQADVVVTKKTIVRHPTHHRHYVYHPWHWRHHHHHHHATTTERVITKTIR